jgi:hypothetical protein
LLQAEILEVIARPVECDHPHAPRRLASHHPERVHARARVRTSVPRGENRVVCVHGATHLVPEQLGFLQRSGLMVSFPGVMSP